jgi:hypothetical protein
MYIIQYLPEYAAKQVVNRSSTFCLRSYRYYKELEDTSENDGIADKSELCADFPASYEHDSMTAGVLISSWSIAQNILQLEPDWELFPNRKSGIAILSTVEAVSQFIEEQIKSLLHDTWRIRHDKVRYYGSSKPKDYKIYDIMFWKSERYANQDEYRFAIIGFCNQAHLQTLIFYNKNYKKPPTYMHKIFLGPEISKSLEIIIHRGVSSLGIFNRVDGWRYLNKT